VPLLYDKPQPYCSGGVLVSGIPSLLLVLALLLVFNVVGASVASKGCNIEQVHSHCFADGILSWTVIDGY